MRQLGPLVKFRLGKLYIGGILALVHKLTDALGGSIPGYDLCGSCISCGATFCKVDAVLCIPYGKLAVFGL